MSEVKLTGEKLKNFINGEWVTPTTTKYDEVPNPATEEVLCQVPISTSEDLDQAVKAAKEAYPAWSNTAVPRRARILFKYQQLLIDNQEELAKLITMEN